MKASAAMTLDQYLESLITSEIIVDQGELLARMHDKGFELTQSTLSRRLKAMGIEKRDGRYRLKRQQQINLTSVTSVLPNLLVLRTLPGFANALAVWLDRAPLPGQAGTIAGDDTVFVAIAPEALTNAEAIARDWL
jgi:transcriptional regulator of arginine metabolism